MGVRMTVWMAVLAALLMGVTPALAAADLPAALGYLKSQQGSDGGFGSGFSPGSALGSTADALLAILAAGGDPAAFDRGGNTPLTYLEANADSAASAGDLSKLILALTAARQSPRIFGGVDSVARLEALIGPDGKIGGPMDTFTSHLLAVLALASVQRPLPSAAMDLIVQAQQANGAWAWDGTAATAADTNSTAFAVQALIAAGQAPESEAVARALAYYRSIQNADGGWPYQNPSDFGTGTDANSTAVTIQALLAAGEDPAGAAWTVGGQTPVAALEALQNESGAFAWKADTRADNLLATVQALPSLAGKAFPLATLAAGEPAAPATMPQTGGGAWDPAWLVGLGGLVAGAGLVLRRKRRAA